jgi:hypothetical protein
MADVPSTLDFVHVLRDTRGMNRFCIGKQETEAIRSVARVGFIDCAKKAWEGRKRCRKQI